MTPYELLICVEADGDRAKERHKELIYQAWHIAAFMRQEKLRDLKLIIQDMDNGPDKEMTDEQIMESVKMWNAACGGVVLDGETKNG